jgi:hypothetical protein
LDTKDFFTRIFPQRDELVICCLRNGIFWNAGSFTDIDDAVAMAARLDSNADTTVYYAVGSFADHRVTELDGRVKITRKKDKATFFKTLALDLDIGEDKPYQTQKQGFVELRRAFTELGLPTPTIVSSGNGLHVYWILSEMISAGQWEKLSIALRYALAEKNLMIDTSKIHDPSMVLRPVGTHHKKQLPWKPVACVLESSDNDPIALATILKPWFHHVKQAVAPAQKKAGKASKVAAAVLQTNDVDVMLVAANCKQIAALVSSGGDTDAAGATVQEPMWRASMGIAKYAIDVETAIDLLAGGHPDFDPDTSMAKVLGWKGTGPTTCAEFEKHCASGCDGCPYRHKVKTPAALSFVVAPPIPAPVGAKFTVPTDYPPGYSVLNGKMMREIPDDTAQSGVVVVPFCDYEMHVTGIYNDPSSGKSAFKLLINYPHSGWKEEDHDVGLIATGGKDFATMLLNRQVFVGKMAEQENIRSYLMSYLTKVQSESPSGVDFIAFGWQKDGSFLCGETVVNSPSGSISRRLRGAASRYADIIKPHGTRDGWIAGAQLLNNPGAETIKAAMLVATAGILGPAAGNASMVLSIYSTETTTGKTLALVGANSLIGSPRELFMNKNDTANALFKVRGVLNNLPCTIDELTAADDKDVVNLAYDLSQGREKIAMDKNRDLREPVFWDGPTLITTNISLHHKFETAQAGNEPLKARTFEIHQHDRKFITSDPKTGSSFGFEFYDIMLENNGWAFPELVELVVTMGGPKEVWRRGEQAFMRKFNFVFEPQERFYRTSIVAGWVMGQIGRTAGLIPFDVNGTTQYLLDMVLASRKDAVEARVDVFDIIGQYLQEFNDQLIEVTEVYNSAKEQVHMPAPERAVARVKIVYDNNSPILPGSTLSINIPLFRTWLLRNKDSLDRVTRELQGAGGLISKKERVTMFKGCHNRNPGQTNCLIVNLNHPRFVTALTGSPKTQSPITLAVLNTAATI